MVNNKIECKIISKNCKIVDPNDEQRCKECESGYVKINNANVYPPMQDSCVIQIPHCKIQFSDYICKQCENDY